MVSRKVYRFQLPVYYPALPYHIRRFLRLLQYLLAFTLLHKSMIFFLECFSSLLPPFLPFHQVSLPFALLFLGHKPGDDIYHVFDKIPWIYDPAPFLYNFAAIIWFYLRCVQVLEYRSPDLFWILFANIFF